MSQSMTRVRKQEKGARRSPQQNSLLPVELPEWDCFGDGGALAPVTEAIPFWQTLEHSLLCYQDWITTVTSLKAFF